MLGRESLPALYHCPMSEAVSLLSVQEVARRLGIEPRRVKQLVRDHILFTYTDGAGNSGIPEEILVKTDNGYEPLFNLPGTLTLLADGGFSPEEAARWLYTENEELGETPMSALLGGRHHRVNRIASVLGF